MQEVTAAFNIIGQDIEKLQEKFMAFTQAFTGFGMLANNQARSVNRAMGSIVGGVVDAKKSVESLKASLASLKAPVITPRIGPAVGGGATGGGGGAGGFGGSVGKSIMRRMVLYAMAYKAAEVVKEGFKQVVMGESRKELAEANAKLSSVGFDAAMKQRADMAANAFERRNPAIKSTEYLEALDQTSSSLDAKQIGMDKVLRANEAAVIGAKIAQQSVGEFSKSIQKLNRTILMNESPKTFQTIISGGTANVKGFGQTDIGAMSEKNAAMIARITHRRQAWGKDIMGGLQYAGQPLLQAGIPLDATTAMIAGLVDVNTKGPKAGRALKDITYSPESLARTWMLGHGEGSMDEKKGKIVFDPMKLRARTAMVREKMKSVESMAQFFPELGGTLKMLQQKLATNPSIAMSMIQDLKMSKNYLPQLLTMLSPTYWATVMGDIADLRSLDGLSFLLKGTKEQSDDVFYQMNQFYESIKRNMQQLARSKGGMAELLQKGMAGLTVGIDKKTEKEGMYNLGDDLRNYKSPQNVMDFINRDYVKKEWTQKLADIKKELGPYDPEKKWDDDRKAIWNQKNMQKRDEAWKEIRKNAHRLYEYSMGTPRKVFDQQDMDETWSNKMSDKLYNKGAAGLNRFTKGVDDAVIAIKSLPSVIEKHVTERSNISPEQRHSDLVNATNGQGGQGGDIHNHYIDVNIDGKDIPAKIDIRKQAQNSQNFYSTGHVMMK